MKDDFYLTLPSNSSMDFFGDNTAAKFVTKLHHTLELGGNWLVGLAEIIFPMSFYNIQEGKNEIRYFFKNKSGTGPRINIDEQLSMTIPPGLYPSIENIIDIINEDHVLKSSINLKYNRVTSHIDILNRDFLVVNPDMGMGEVLGINPVLGFGLRSHFPANLYKQIPQQLFVYSDILQPQLLGDTVASLLRIVGIENRTEFDKVIVKTYDSPHYVPLLKRQFETIEIDIRDHTGKSAPFLYGPVIVKLHFKHV